MARKMVFCVLFISVIILTYSYAGEVKLTTYYPAPYGEYKRVVTQTLGVGDNDGSGGINSADAPDPTATPGDIWIKGKVGVGTTTPAGKLHIVNGTFLSERSIADTENIIVRNSADNDGVVANDQGSLVLAGGGTNGYMAFYTGGTSNAYERMRIDKNGNVGIGTTNPKYMMHTFGTIAASATSRDEVVQIFVDSGGKGVFNYGGTPSPNDYLEFRVENVPRMTINAFGNVGIGTATPQAKLDVVGDGNGIIVPRKSTAGDPTAVNGMIYYNSNSRKFRVCEDGTWKNLAGGGQVLGTWQLMSANTNYVASSDGFIVFYTGGPEPDGYSIESYAYTSGVLRTRATGYNGSCCPVRKGETWKVQLVRQGRANCVVFWIPFES